MSDGRAQEAKAGGAKTQRNMSLRGAQRRGNPGLPVLGTLDCFAPLAMTITLKLGVFVPWCFNPSLDRLLPHEEHKSNMVKKP
jgi:hypothetical protein